MPSDCFKGVEFCTFLPVTGLLLMVMLPSSGISGIFIALGIILLGIMLVSCRRRILIWIDNIFGIKK